ncbi:Antizyme inhibitor 1 [Acipenser ruthenus]|uniref:Antizyme inhibitor 1 n=1 Tax=Acipenser ruthenus TaxID=7906 RepID=A0A444UJJ6_ACIRT|nr:antizyme inhibitor 1-like [Acipenser ruthenus]RXM35278.1 Antizyme inhibitor 1 [Acipenser ruthenus]
MKGFVDEPNYTIDLLEEGTTLSDVIDNHIYEQALVEKNAFFVADLGNVVKKHIQWQNVMAQIKPFYTVKCNTSTALIEILAALGIGFACASKNEIALVQSFGVAPENIIYTSMCKQLSQIKYAAKNGIDILVCDNETELMKIARNHPSAKLLLHIATEASSEGEEMSMDFGSTLKNSRHLLECAKELGVEVVGVKFHISSFCKDLQAYTHAVSDARCVFDMGVEFGFNMSILDIGGGFSGAEFQLEEIYSAISPLLDIYFPPESGVSVIAEPGSYYVASSFTLAVNIIAKKVVARDQNKELEPSPNDEPAYMYYMNDGVYGSFASKLTDNTIAVPSVHKKYSKEEAVFASSLWGPSSDGLDQVIEHCLLPELNVGDWVTFDNMGANTLGEQSAFNDFQKPPVYYLISAFDWYEMQDAGITLDTTMKNFFVVPSCFHASQEDRISAPA